VAAAPAEKGEVIATYKGREITSVDLVKELERLPAPSRVYLTQAGAPATVRRQHDHERPALPRGEQQGSQNDPEIERRSPTCGSASSCSG
jgi:hypothetical protein